MKRSKRLLVAATVMVVASGCSSADPAVSSSTTTAEQTTTTTEATTATGNWGSALAAAGQLWDSAGPSSYEIVYVTHCECDPGWAGPWRVTVIDGEVESMVHENGAETFEGPEALTVEGLFELVETGLATLDPPHSIEFDPTYGFPSQIALDVEALAVDGGVSMSVWEFTPTE